MKTCDPLWRPHKREQPNEDHKYKIWYVHCVAQNCLVAVLVMIWQDFFPLAVNSYYGRYI